MKNSIIVLCAVLLFRAALDHLGAVWTALLWLLGALLPVLLGFAFAFLLEPFASLLERSFPRGHGHARLFSVALAYLFVAAALTLLVVLILPQLRDAWAILAETAPVQLQNALNWLQETAAGFGLELPDLRALGWQELTDSLGGVLPTEAGSGLLGRFLGAAGSLAGTVADVALGAVIGFHILLHREGVARFFRRFLRAFAPERTAAALLELTSLSAHAFRDFMSGQLTEAVALGFMCALGMTLFRFPYPAAASAIIGVSALVPVFGAWIGGAAGFLLALTESSARALLFVLFIVVLQLVDNTFIYPRIVGNSMKLEGMLVLCAVTVGGSLFGVAGMLLGVPACSVLYTLLTRAIEKRLGAKHLTKNP